MVENGTPVDPANPVAEPKWGPHNSDVDAYDADGHWKECSVCGMKVTDKQPHVWVVEGGRRYCSECGYIVESDMPSGGFDVSMDTGEPQGTLNVSNEGQDFTFSFINKEGCEPPTVFQWYVDGVLQQGQSSDSFAFSAPLPRYYVVMCIFRNNSGSGSLDSQIIGGGSAHAL